MPKTEFKLRTLVKLEETRSLLATMESIQDPKIYILSRIKKHV